MYNKKRGVLFIDTNFDNFWDNQGNVVLTRKSMQLKNYQIKT
jgi:hypothetical protein